MGTAMSLDDIKRPSGLGSLDSTPVAGALNWSADTQLADSQVLIFPLTPQQLSAWNADRKSPRTPTLNGAFRFEISGDVQAESLQQAFSALAERHEMLRARFALVEGSPQLIVAQSSTFALKFTDLRGRALAVAKAEMEQLSYSEATRGFDLEVGPMVRAELIRLPRHRSVLLLTVHQIAADSWAVSRLVEELAEIYCARCEGRSPKLPELTIQFGDYACWVSEQAVADHASEQIDYWRRQLDGYVRFNVAPTLAHCAGSPHDAEIATRSLPVELTTALLSLGARQGGTMFTITLAACLIVLQQETGRQDITIGTPMAGRDRFETEMLIGPLLNNVLIRTRFSGDDSFQVFEAQVRQTVLDAIMHQAVPLEIVAQVLKESGRRLPDPIFNVAFVCQRGLASASSFTIDLGDCQMRGLPSKSQGALHDLFFFLGAVAS